MYRFFAFRPSLALCLILSLPALEARATVLTYAVNSASGDSWTGSLVVPDMSAAIDLDSPPGTTSLTSLTAVSGTTTYSWASEYCGLNSTIPYIQWAGFSDGFSDLTIESAAFASLYTSGNDTWADAVSTGTFAVSGNTSVSYQGTSNVLLGTGGTITFAIAVPEPATCVVVGSAVLMSAAFARRRIRRGA